MSSRSRFVRLTQKSLWSLALFAPLAAAAQHPIKTNVSTGAKAATSTGAKAATSTGAKAATPAPVADQTGTAVLQQVVIAGSVPDAVAKATRLGPLNPDQSLSVLVCFAFADPQAAQDYADAVSDPRSLLYRQWLTPQEVGQKFGPDPDAYAAMLTRLQANGLQVDEMPANHLTLRVRGTVAQVEHTFGVNINQYREAPADAVLARGADAIPYDFYAPDAPLQIPAELDGKITSVEGLETYTRPILHSKKLKRASANFDAVQPRVGYDLAAIYNTLSATTNNKPGTGRVVGISNFVGVSIPTNGTNFITKNALPVPAAGALSNVTRITVNNASGAENAEADLDFQMVLGQAPLANILIYDNGSNDLVGVLAKEASDNLADVLTESYGWNLGTGAAASAHSQHVTMTMQGQTYLAASGDSGNVATTSFQYSDYEPEVLIIGGTALTVDANNAYIGETGWSGSGGGVSTATVPFNVRPAWQAGRNVPTTNKRNSPDVSAHAAGSGGGAYNFYYKNALQNGYVGTSFAAPVEAGQIALLEQYLISLNALPANSAGKRRLGRLQDTIYALNGRSDVFHDITTGGASPALGTTPYWDYTTGWGSIDWGNLALALTTPLSVSVTPASQTIIANQTEQLTASVTGSAYQAVNWSIVSGPGTISATGLYTPPSSVTGSQTKSRRAIRPGKDSDLLPRSVRWRPRNLRRRELLSRN